MLFFFIFFFQHHKIYISHNRIILSPFAQANTEHMYFSSGENDTPGVRVSLIPRYFFSNFVYATMRYLTIKSIFIIGLIEESCPIIHNLLRRS